MNDKDTPLPEEMPTIQNLPSGNQGQRPVKIFIIIKASQILYYNSLPLSMVSLSTASDTRGQWWSENIKLKIPEITNS